MDHKTAPQTDGKKTLRDHLEKAVVPYVPAALIILLALFIGTYTYSDSLSSPAGKLSNPSEWLRNISLNGLLDFCKSNLANLSAALIAAYISFKIYDGYLMRGAREQDQRDFVEKIADGVNLKVTRGLLGLHNRLDPEIIADSIARTEHTIIVETWIGWETLDRLKDGFLKAFNNGYSATIYLLHPNSPNVGRRQLDIAPNDRFSGREEVLRSLNKIASIREEWITTRKDRKVAEEAMKAQLKVICYDSLPALQIYKLQDRAVVGLYLNGGISNNNCQFEISLEGRLGKDILKHIELYTHEKKLWHIRLPDLSKHINRQFDSVHLECQLEDSAKQLINLGNDEIELFGDILVGLLSERERLGYLEKRKENLQEVLERIKTRLSTAPLV